MEVLLISQFLGNYSYLLKTKLSNENNFVHSCKLELTITNLSIILFKVWNVIVNVKCEEGGWALLSGGGDESGPCPTVQCYRVYLLYPMTVTAGPHSRVTVPLHWRRDTVHHSVSTAGGNHGLPLQDYSTVIDHYCY